MSESSDRWEATREVERRLAHDAAMRRLRREEMEMAIATHRALVAHYTGLAAATTARERYDAGLVAEMKAQTAAYERIAVALERLASKPTPL